MKLMDICFGTGSREQKLICGFRASTAPHGASLMRKPIGLATWFQIFEDGDTLALSPEFFLNSPPSISTNLDSQSRR